MRSGSKRVISKPEVMVFVGTAPCQSNSWCCSGNFCSFTVVLAMGVGGLAQGLGGWLCYPVAVPIGLSPLNLLL